MAGIASEGIQNPAKALSLVLNRPGILTFPPFGGAGVLTPDFQRLKSLGFFSLRNSGRIFTS